MSRRECELLGGVWLHFQATLRKREFIFATAMGRANVSKFGWALNHIHFPNTQRAYNDCLYIFFPLLHSSPSSPTLSLSILHLSLPHSIHLSFSLLALRLCYILSLFLNFSLSLSLSISLFLSFSLRPHNNISSSDEHSI